MDHSIHSFLKEEKIFSLCTSLHDIPHTAICYYALEEERNWLVFCSENKTLHIQNALINRNVSGSILPMRCKTAFTRGLQFSGIFAHHSELECANAKSLYYKKYPLALAMKGDVWIIQLTKIKMTDNRPGFPKKIQWLKEATAV